MTNQNNNNVLDSRLLSDQEREAFKMISTGNDLHGQRAIALLAIDDGATQAQAAEQSGLTTGQVKYWLGKFRQVRMDIFPEQVLQTDQVEPDQDVQKAKKAKKAKKTKKAKGKKAKSKKPKKTKKAKAKKTKGKAKKKGKGKKKKNKK
jgi:outer membrane biosynthesis protein TonB